MPLVFAVPFNTRLLFSEEMRGWVLAVAPAFVFKLSTRPHCTLVASVFAHLLSESSRSLPALKGLHDMSEKQLVAGDGSTSKSVPCIRVQTQAGLRLFTSSIRKGSSELQVAAVAYGSVSA